MMMALEVLLYTVGFFMVCGGVRMGTDAYTSFMTFKRYG